MPEPNCALLRKTLEFIREHPGDWYQGSWTVSLASLRAALLVSNPEMVSWARSLLTAAYSPEVAECGAFACFAGWAVRFAGAKSFDTYLDINDLPEIDRSPFVVSRPGIDQAEIHVSDYAKWALGLTPQQAKALFRGANTFEDLELIVDGLCGDDASDVE